MAKDKGRKETKKPKKVKIDAQQNRRIAVGLFWVRKRLSLARDRSAPVSRR